MRPPSCTRLRIAGVAAASLASVLLSPAAAIAPPPRVTVGSKAFSEGVILGEILTQTAAGTGADAVHRRELGGTRIVWSALVAGDVDAYVEYTGTLREEILAGRDVRTDGALRDALHDRGVVMSPPLGFNNTYVLGMKKTLAESLKVERISDLARHPGLRFGFSNEFLDRGDGWPGLRMRDRLPQTDVNGMEHALAYRGIASGAIQVTDLYSTDAEIPYYRLVGLIDDLGYFPDYHAVILYREDLRTRAPRVVAAFLSLAGAISESTMAAMNARVKIDRLPESQVAAEFLRTRGTALPGTEIRGRLDRVARRTREHLLLVAVSLAAAVATAIPLGIAAARNPGAGRIILGAVAAIQTVPSLALLVLMIPLVGIGGPPALIALFLYSLLPVVRNTHAGLTGIPSPLLESADALGLPPRARLRRVELPLAAPSILAGIKTSAVINVGTATLGALVGAGGYGQPILTGIRLDDMGLILEGALPAAALALLVQGGFDLVERTLVSKGLRLRGDSRTD
jgi:osmoprotectant transport system permease protein